MTDKTVTLPVTDWRTLAEFLDDRADITPDGDLAHITSRIKAALPPEWEEGTVAWVTDHGPSKIRTLCERRGGKWVTALQGDDSPYDWRDDVPAKVEPLRVLGDDEIAVKRDPSFTSPAGLRSLAESLERKYEAQACDIVRAVADALAAEGRA